MTHEALKIKALQKEAVQLEYESLAPEFALLRNILSIRIKTRVKQAQIAERMKTKPSAVTHF
jgi:DNA-binding transcriptional regulator YiaG